MARQINDLTGKKFSKLTVIEKDSCLDGRGMFWKCSCECGGSKVVRSANLLNGSTKSCGCVARGRVSGVNPTMAPPTDFTESRRKIIYIRKLSAQEQGLKEARSYAEMRSI
jgi:hypothetical protein